MSFRSLSRQIRLFVRKHTKPIQEDKAALWKKRLAIIYAVVGWNAAGLIIYNVLNAHQTPESKTKSPAHYWSKAIGAEDTTVFKVSGFKVVSTYQVHNEYDEKKKLIGQTTTVLSGTPLEETEQKQ